MNSIAKNNNQIGIIEVLRIFGALCIFLFHSLIFGDHLYFAVELFSVISGFVVMQSTQKGSKGFLLKRIKRIVPLYWLYTIVMYILIRIMPSLSIMSEAKPVYLIKSLFFIPFINTLNAPVPVLGLGWMLEYQMFFYCIFAIVLVLTNKNEKAYKLRGVITIGACLVFCILTKIIHVPYELEYYGDYFLMEFSLGIICYIVYSKTKDKFTLNKVLALIIAAFMIALCIYLESASQIVRVIRLGIPVAVMFLALLLGFKDLKLSEFWKRQAAASYIFFLTEYFTTAFFKAVSGSLPIGLRILLLILILAITIILSSYIGKLLEVLKKAVKKNE